LPGSGRQSLGDHGVLVVCDARARGAAEIEDEDRVCLGLSGGKVAREEAAYVFGEGNTQVAGTPAGAALKLRRQGDFESSTS